MLQNKTNKPIADLAGTVVHAFPPNQNPDNGKWRPANFEIETESGVVKVKHFPYSYFDKEQGVRVTPEPIQMPEWYKQLERFGATLHGLEGLKVQIKGAGTINETTMAVEYTVVGENFVVVEGEAPDSIEEPATPVRKDPVVTLASIDPNQMRIMRQSTLGYSATLLAGKEFASHQLMVERTIQVATKLLEYVISGEMPSFDEEAEVEEDIV